jgi:hypothetical protein
MRRKYKDSEGRRVARDGRLLCTGFSLFGELCDAPAETGRDDGKTLCWVHRRPPAVKPPKPEPAKRERKLMVRRGPCWECGGLPHRVEGKHCKRCGLGFVEELPAHAIDSIGSGRGFTYPEGCSYR